MIIELKNKKVSIIGAARSGVAAAEIVLEHGGYPFVSDSGHISDDSLSQRLKAPGIGTEFGGHSDKVFDSDLMIVSPAVPLDAEIITKARSRRIPVWPEIELAYRLCKGKIIGVTGSNGKTTTTVLIGEMLKNFGLPTYVCGNIGNPFVAVASTVSENGFAVVELSSFQLEQIKAFRPSIAVFLNLTPDHLDRHKNLETYIAAKMRIFENQNSADIAIINHDDEILQRESIKIRSEIRWFSTRSSLQNGVWGYPDGELYVDRNKLMYAKEIKIKGEHNLSNACAATAAALAAGVSPESIVQTLKSFAGVEHRLEPVRLIGGVSFINDSKGTNVDSVYWALKAVSAPVILIAGGKDKGGDFSVLDDIVSKKVKLVILIGQASDKIAAAWQNLVRCVRADSMETAVHSAYHEAGEGDTVLLSPGCASFDMFDNYEHRGRIFKKAVAELMPGKDRA